MKLPRWLRKRPKPRPTRHALTIDYTNSFVTLESETFTMVVPFDRLEDNFHADKNAYDLDVKTNWKLYPHPYASALWGSTPRSSPPGADPTPPHR